MGSWYDGTHIISHMAFRVFQLHHPLLFRGGNREREKVCVCVSFPHWVIIGLECNAIIV